jgi:hypothetical protein
VKRLLIDNDAVLKLARYGLLTITLDAFGLSPNFVYVLPTAKYSLLPSTRRLHRCKDERTANSLEEFFSVANVLASDSADYTLVDLLSEQEGIDAGEAIMFAIAAQDQNAFVLTGDKRALAALRSADAASAISDALTERMLTLEIVFASLIQYDFTVVQEYVRTQPTVDKALSNAFGVVAPASFQSVQDALNSYIAHLKNVTDPLLRGEMPNF